MSDLFIKPEYLQELLEIFKMCCPHATVLAYGSRIKNEAHSGSDLDLAVKNVNGRKILMLKEKLSDSNIPFLVDVFEFDMLPLSFQQEIAHKNVVIFGEGPCDL